MLRCIYSQLILRELFYCLADFSNTLLVVLDPGTQNYPYCVVLPDFHAPGTYWYHAHRHGSNAVQTSTGMVGAIIVEDPKKPELTPAVPEDRDLVFVIQEIVGEGAEEEVYTLQGRFGGAEFLINGVCRPTLKIGQGQLMRWRFINGTATPRGFGNIKLCPASSSIDTSTSCTGNIPMDLMAVDGILFYGNEPQPQPKGWDLAPGNRADFLVKFSEPGTYKIVKDQPSYRVNASTPQVLAYSGRRV
jgi:FtsP/CotA-like multicopper oxidase with cupredoxin domain